MNCVRLEKKVAHNQLALATRRATKLGCQGKIRISNFCNCDRNGMNSFRKVLKLKLGETTRNQKKVTGNFFVVMGQALDILEKAPRSEKLGKSKQNPHFELLSL